MIALRSSALAVVLTLAFVVLARPLGAQTDEPLVIVPQSTEPRQAPAKPPPAEGAQPSGEASAPVAPERRQGAAKPDVEVATVEPPDPEAAGLYGKADGGLGVDMWRGTSRALVERLLPRLPIGSTWPAMNDLVRRLLLSVATPPEGPANADLLALRVERLAAMGEGAAMNHLLRAASGTENLTLARARLDAYLLTADHASACALARELVGRDDAPYWDRVMIFCQAMAGRYEAAELGVRLLRERGIKRDAAFKGLLRALARDNEVELDSLRQPTALHLAMLREARVPVPADAVGTASPAITRAIALTASAPLELRLRAAERAEAMGVLPTKTLAELYASAPFTPDNLAKPLSHAEDETEAKTRALLYQAARNQAVPSARAEILEAWWRHGRDHRGWAGFATAARASLEMLMSLTPTTELTWIAGDAARALLAAGRPRQARAWLALAHDQATASADARAAFVTLRPLARIAGEDDDLPWQDGQLAAWWRAQAEPNALARRARAALLLGVLDALGHEVAAEARLPLLRGPLKQWSKTPVPALWQQLESAAADDRIGETVLLALLALRSEPSSQPSPFSVTKAVSALYRVGLTDEARAVALQAALSRDL